ncbi:ABC transporter permease subunit [Eubacteriales bacterium OttesenSCG-928-A19]|nr:ABC transporter permease subunit [Eubacteriales bacterium OttesenSCG-928-A19]
MNGLKTASSSGVINRPKKTNALLTHWQLYVMLVLPILYLLIFCYMPMLDIQIAFKKYAARLGVWASPWVGLANFERFINSYQFWPIVRNTLVISFYSIFATLPTAVILALCLNAMRHKGTKKVVQLMTYMPNFISTVVMVGILKQLLHPRMGLYALAAEMLGIPTVDVFGSAAAFPHLYVWSNVWQKTGWSSIIYLAALSAVDPEQHEAAIVDGASRFQRVLHIDLPTILPTMAIMLILNMGQVMSVGFERVYLMQTDLNLATSEIVSTYVYKVGLTGMPDYSYSTAINLFNSVINLVLIVTMNALAKKTGDSGLF